jgi:cell division protein FtsZ
MTLTLTPPEQPPELKPRIIVFGVGGAGGNAVNNMIRSNLEGVECVVANTDAQALSQCLAERKVQLGLGLTQGLGAGSRPEVGRAAAEEGMEEILSQIQGGHMVFVTAGMGGGTGTGAAPVVAAAARDQGLLTVGVVTKPFHFEGSHRMVLADEGIDALAQVVDTLIVIPNQNLFKVADEKTTFTDAFQMADEVLYAGVRGVTELMISPGLINLDFADIRSIMDNGGKAMMGSGEADGESRALASAEAAIANPLLEESSLSGASGCLINITGGPDLTLYEVDEAANRIRDEVDPNANIIFGSVLDDSLEGRMRVSIFATGVDSTGVISDLPAMGTASRTPTPPPAIEVTEETSDTAPTLDNDGTQISILSSSITGAEPEAAELDRESSPTNDGVDQGRDQKDNGSDGPRDESHDDLPSGGPTVSTADPVRISPASSRQTDFEEPVVRTEAPGEAPERKDTATKVPASEGTQRDRPDETAVSDPDDEPEPEASPFVISNPPEPVEDISPPATPAALESEVQSQTDGDGGGARAELPPWPEAEAGQPDMFTPDRPSPAFGPEPTEAASDLPDPGLSSNRSLRQALLADDPDLEVLENSEPPEFLRNVEPVSHDKDKGNKRSFLSRLVKRSGEDKDGTNVTSRLPANDGAAEPEVPHFADPGPLENRPAASVAQQPEPAPLREPVTLAQDMAQEPPRNISETVILDSKHRGPEEGTPATQRAPEPAAMGIDNPPRPTAAEPVAQTTAKSAPSDDELLEIPAFLRRQSN